MLMIFELLTVLGFLLVFYHLFVELKLILAAQKYQQVKYRTATYLALISILNSARFFYYGVMSLTLLLVPNVDFKVDCADLIPSYVTELAFCLFVVFHIFIEGKTKYVEAQSGDSSSTLKLTSQISVDSLYAHETRAGSHRERKIPVYIVRESDCLDAQPTPDSDLLRSSPVLKYAAIDDQKEVLLV